MIYKGQEGQSISNSQMIRALQPNVAVTPDNKSRVALNYCYLLFYYFFGKGFSFPPQSLPWAFFLKNPRNRKLCWRASIFSSSFCVLDCRFLMVSFMEAADCSSFSNTPAGVLV